MNGKVIPTGKTVAVITSDVHQSMLRQDDIVYIDGYVRGGTGIPLAAVVRVNDGLVDICAIHQCVALVNGVTAMGGDDNG